jgi:putative membrane protein
MFRQSLMVTFVTAIVLAGSAEAQTQPPAGGAGQTSPDIGSRPTNTPSMGNPAGNPGAVPQDMQMDPYAADKDFLKNAAESSAAQVQLGKLAQEKASSDAVKEFGKQMVTAHTQTGDQLKEAAAALKMQLPAEPPRKAKKAEEKLAKLSGADFDRTYAKMAADEQKQTVKQFEREAKNGKVQAMKDFAAKNLPAEQERQKQAEELTGGGTKSADRQK